MIEAQARAELAPTGAIRVAINVANPALVSVAADDTLGGRCVDLAAGLAARLGVPIDYVRFASAGQVVAAELAGDAWDLAFLAIDPARAQRLHFSPPYLSVEAGYAVPAWSRIVRVEDVDRAGVRIASSVGAAYDLHLKRILRSAERQVFADPAASFDAFAAGGYDVVAGLRLALERRFAEGSRTRVLPGHFLAIHQAMVVPIARRAAADLIDAFVLEAVGHP